MEEWELVPVEERLRKAKTAAERNQILQQEADIAIYKTMFAQNYENGSVRLQRASLRNLQSMKDYLGINGTGSGMSGTGGRESLAFRRAVLEDF